jgi:hypothetical protein
MRRGLVKRGLVKRAPRSCVSQPHFNDCRNFKDTMDSQRALT